jgi:hypothetical protein
MTQRDFIGGIAGRKGTVNSEKGTSHPGKVQQKGTTHPAKGHNAFRSCTACYATDKIIKEM